MAARKPHIANAIKDMGASKARTRGIADRARPTPERKPASRTATGQGGSRKGGIAPDSPHPSQRGGVKPDARGEARRGNPAPSRRSGEKAPGTGLTKGPSRGRTGTTAAGGRARTGRDTSGGPDSRGRARGNSRTSGRSRARA